jgi:hypothetical protein
LVQTRATSSGILSVDNETKEVRPGRERPFVKKNFISRDAPSTTAVSRLNALGSLRRASSERIVP